MQTMEEALRLFHEAIDRFFNPYDISDFGRLENVLKVGSKLLYQTSNEKTMTIF